MRLRNVGDKPSCRLQTFKQILQNLPAASSWKSMGQLQGMIFPKESRMDSWYTWVPWTCWTPLYHCTIVRCRNSCISFFVVHDQEVVFCCFLWLLLFQEATCRNKCSDLTNWGRPYKSNEFQNSVWEKHDLQILATSTFSSWIISLHFWRA